MNDEANINGIALASAASDIATAMSNMATNVDCGLIGRNTDGVRDKGVNHNVVDGLFAIADALNAVAMSVDKLGLNGAATGMGAIELLSKTIKEGLGNSTES